MRSSLRLPAALLLAAAPMALAPAGGRASLHGPPSPEAAAPSAPTAASEATPPPWGAHGHSIAARAAVAGLPGGMPEFFRGAADRLEYLNPEPDRWRDAPDAAGDAWAYDHYVDMENVPPGALEEPDRWSFLDYVYRNADLGRPARDTGFLPYRIMELYYRLVEEWRLWTRAPAAERPWVEERILNDAGLLGHYVTDASQPHHTTIHFDGWDARAGNPEGFSTERGFHGRFEWEYVDAAVPYPLLPPLMSDEPRHVEDVWGATLDFIRRTHDEVEALYRLDREVGFRPEAPHPEATAFAARRVAAGAQMLRDLWWSAWLEGTGEREP